MTPADHEKHATRLADAGPYTATAQVHATLAVAGQLARLGESIERAARLMAAEPPALPDPGCPHCHGLGYTEGPGCNCGAGPGGHFGAHERYCGLEQCPAGCPFVPPRPPQRLGGGD
jgi:hypothetical protein